MKVTLNGQKKDFAKTMSLAQMIRCSCKNSHHMIVELNGCIIKRPHWPRTSVKEGDRIELVTFVGGG
jgi:sulfur carrier protein